MFFSGPNYGTPVFVAGPNTADMCVYEAGPNTAQQTLFQAGPNTGRYTIFIAGCFLKSELVQINSDTYIPIGLLKMGDRISSWDIEYRKAKCTSVTEIHKYRVMQIVCFNNSLQVSSSHPIMVMENEERGVFIPKWKVAYDVNIGDQIVGTDGKFITIRSNSTHWYNGGIEVINLSTDNGVPFSVRNCIVRAENAKNRIDWANTPITQKLIS